MTVTAEPERERRRLTVLVLHLDYEDLRRAAAAADLSIAQWVRRAVREKLDRETA